MARAITVALGCLLAVAPALAHHGPSVLGTVRLTQPVTAGGQVLSRDIRDAAHGRTRGPAARAVGRC